MKYCRYSLIILLSVVLFTSCAYIKDAGIVGKDKSAIVLQDGIPHKEFKYEGFDIIQYRLSCGVTRTQNYCELKDYFLKDGAVVKVMYRIEYYDYPIQK